MAAIGWQSCARLPARLRLALPALLAVCLIAGPVLAAGFESGLDAYRRGDLARAVAVWMQAAEAGSPAALYALGVIHETGEGVAADDAKAAQFYERAAATEYPLAERNLGRMAFEGRGLEPDLTRGSALLIEALDAGVTCDPCRLDDFALGLMYRDGLGVAPSKPLAIEHLKAAAEAGDTQAQLALGQLLETASPPRLREALFWYGIASALQPKARSAAARRGSSGVAARVGPEVAAEVAADVERWLAVNGHPPEVEEHPPADVQVARIETEAPEPARAPIAPDERAAEHAAPARQERALPTLGDMLRQRERTTAPISGGTRVTGPLPTLGETVRARNVVAAAHSVDTSPAPAPAPEVENVEPAERVVEPAPTSRIAIAADASAAPVTIPAEPEIEVAEPETEPEPESEPDPKPEPPPLRMLAAPEPLYDGSGPVMTAPATVPPELQPVQAVAAPTARINTSRVARATNPVPAIRSAPPVPARRPAIDRTRAADRIETPLDAIGVVAESAIDGFGIVIDAFRAEVSDLVTAASSALRGAPDCADGSGSDGSCPSTKADTARDKGA
jgi:hypothetical protein